MKFEAINRRITEIVSEYMARGYYINLSSSHNIGMDEVGKVDLTNGDEIIRVYVRNDRENAKDYTYSLEILTLVVGRVPKEKKVVPNTERCSWSPWNHELEELSTECYYKVGDNWYVNNRDEAIGYQLLHRERYGARLVKDCKTLSWSAKAIVLPWIKRQRGWKGIRLADIDSVVKCTDRRLEYRIFAKGKYLYMGVRR